MLLHLLSLLLITLVTHGFESTDIMYVEKTDNHGGTSGKRFEYFKESPGIEVRKLIIRDGSLIDSIQVELSDADHRFVSPSFGGSGGSRSVWEVPQGEYIKKVEVRSGSLVDSLKFITNTGQESPKFGGNGGSYHVITFPEGYRMIGIYGKSGSLIDKIGFYIGKTVRPDPPILSVSKTSLYGRAESSSFEFYKEEPFVSVREITISYVEYIDSIQLKVQDLNNQYVSPVFGGAGKYKETWQVPVGEFITEVEIASGAFIDSLEFITDKGSRSPKFGGNGGLIRHVVFQKGYHLIGVYGFSDSFITKIGFILGKTEVVEPDPENIFLYYTPGYGGNGGKEFEYFKKIHDQEVRNITLWSGDVIQSIQVILNNDKNIYASPRFGGNGGSQQIWEVPEGEHITRVDIEADNLVNSLKFFTNAGRKSAKFGQGGGTLHSVIFPDGYRMVGVYGRSGSLIDKIGFILARAFPTNALA